MPHENGQLTAEELEPDDDQLALGRQRVAEGWESVSNKGRLIRRWTTAHLQVRDLIKPKLLDSPEGRWWLEKERDRFLTPSLRMPPKGLPFEELQLSVRDYRAFRLAGGKSTWP